MKKLRYWKYVGLMGVVLFPLFYYMTGGFQPGSGYLPYLSPLPTPPGSGWYVDEQKGRPNSHAYIFLNNMGPSMANAKDADIIFLGDSRSLEGFDWKQVNTFSEKTGLKVFNLALDGSVGWELPLRLMIENNIKPKIILLTIPEVLVNGVAGYSKAALDASSLSRFKQVLSNEIYWRFKNLCGQISPTLFWLFPLANHDAMYRSNLTGFWDRNTWQDEHHFPIRDDKETCQQYLISMPSEFQKFLTTNKCTLVIGNIPVSYYCLARTHLLADKLGVPYVEVPSDGLTTVDWTHLDTRSSEEFTRIFLDKFSALKIVRDLSSR